MHLHDRAGTLASTIIIIRYVKHSNLRKEVGITIKSKETSRQLEPVRNSHVYSYIAPTCNC